MSHTYQKQGDKYVVVFSLPNSPGRPFKEFDTEEDAAAYVSYLNGGAEPKKAGKPMS